MADLQKGSPSCSSLHQLKNYAHTRHKRITITLIAMLSSIFLLGSMALYCSAVSDPTYLEEASAVRSLQADEGKTETPEALKVLESGEYNMDLQMLMAYVMGVLWFTLMMCGLCLCFNTNTYFLCC